VPNSPKKKPAKVAKKASKKPSKRGVASKGATPRQKAERNKELLRGDLAFYESQEKKNFGRRTKGTANHPRGIPLYALHQDARGNWVSSDGEVKLSDREYERLANNPDAIPKYTPIKRGGKIVRYRNTRTGDIVTPYYRHQIFGKTFNNIEDEASRVRSELYVESLEQMRHARLSRHHNLAESYQLVHPDMSLNEIYRSNDFQTLVEELTTFNYKAYGINLENIEIAQNAGYNIDMETAKRELGRNQEYQQVLAALGRRLPSDNHPVGDSEPNYINDKVREYWARQYGEEE
jgi:hypothetical protein